MADFDDYLISELFSDNSNDGWCYNYSKCHFNYRSCQKDDTHQHARYTEGSAAWVLIASIIVFFMKAGFMLLEVAFARTPKEKRYVVVLKHQDAFASAFGFFLIGFDALSLYSSPIDRGFFTLTDPVLWFFKFTFASNAATIVGGCLVTNRYKLRLPAAFISAFVISGILHPIVARIIWSDHCQSLSPYRFCQFNNTLSHIPVQSCGHNCTKQISLGNRLYVLDFAGGGAVHLLGGMAGLMVCLFARFQEWRDKKARSRKPGCDGSITSSGAEEQEDRDYSGFWDWMYPVHGGEETVSEAALGVFILWFCWFAFNCGSTESVEVGYDFSAAENTDRFPFYGVPSVIAVNMILAGASGGIVAIVIATWAQMRYGTETVNANEIANGVLSSLVSITAGCPFVDYWGACLIGALGVVFYHFGCWLEYKFDIKDTARVVPVHAVCGLWSVIATALFLVGHAAECNLHASFEGLCYCILRLPPLNYGERLLAQIIGALIMIGVGGGGAFITYFILYITPIWPVKYLPICLPFLRPVKREGVVSQPVHYIGGWLLTRPEEMYGQHDRIFETENTIDAEPSSHGPLSDSRTNLRVVGRPTYGTSHRSHLGSRSDYRGSLLTPSGTQTYGSSPPSVEERAGSRASHRRNGTGEANSGTVSANVGLLVVTEEDEAADNMTL